MHSAARFLAFRRNQFLRGDCDAWQLRQTLIQAQEMTQSEDLKFQMMMCLTVLDMPSVAE